MRKFTQLLYIAMLVPVLTACASNHYQKTQVGQLSGKLVVQWLKPDEFMFVPDKEKPLKFVRGNHQVIIPERMYTDGGSIPRPLWAIKNYSPWGYAPAFIIHDWLFEMKHCNLEGNEDYDVYEAAQVLSEVIKTLMEKNEDVEENRFVLYSMHKAVSSGIAAGLWEHGTCERVTTRAITEPIMEYTIEFP